MKPGMNYQNEDNDIAKLYDIDYSNEANDITQLCPTSKYGKIMPTVHINHFTNPSKIVSRLLNK